MDAGRDPSVFDLRMTGRGGALGMHTTNFAQNDRKAGIDTGRDAHPFGCASRLVFDLRMTGRGGALGMHPTTNTIFPETT